MSARKARSAVRKTGTPWAAEAFARTLDGFYDPTWAGKLVVPLFAPRNAIEPADAYRAFRGRDAGIEPLMRDRGFPVPGE